MTNIESFIDEYGKLVKKHNVDFMSIPVFRPTGKGGFEVIIQTQPVDLNELKKDGSKNNFIVE